MSRPLARAIAPIALLLGLSACYVTSAAPRSSITDRRPLIPLSVLVCGDAADSAATAMFDAEHLFRHVTRDPTAPVDLVASVRVVGRKDRTLVSNGFFLWTLGVIPWVTSARRDVEAVFRRPTSGVAACPPSTPDAGTAAATPGLAIRARGGIRTVQGWAGLLLQPTPWWSSDRVSYYEPPGDLSRNLPLRAREALSRAILARQAELSALAGLE